MDFFSCYASAAFGFEGLVAEELRTYHLRDVRAENGGVRFSATLEELYLCNLRLRYSDRVFLLVAEQHCTSFEDLFQLVFSVPWGDYVRGNEALNFSAHCTRSILMSPRDCQSIGKKAMIEKLKKDPGISHFPENGPAFPVVISIHSDKARITINMSGNALSRRGYRTWNGEAPIRETLAAALVHLSPWKPGRPVYEKTLSTLIQTNETYESTQIDAFFESKPKIDAFLKIDANVQRQEYKMAS